MQSLDRAMLRNGLHDRIIIVGFCLQLVSFRPTLGSLIFFFLVGSSSGGLQLVKQLKEGRRVGQPNAAYE
jgi:hypothetical protein